MSSCCLAACGRLAENSQSGEAALTLCGRAPAAHLHPALRGWGGERGVSAREFCPLPLPSAVPRPGGAGEAPSPPFALPVLFHPPTSVHPRLPAGSAAQDSPKGPAGLSPAVLPLPLALDMHGISSLAQARSDARLELLLSAGGASPRPRCLRVTARCPFLAVPLLLLGWLPGRWQR